MYQPEKRKLDEFVKYVFVAAVPCIPVHIMMELPETYIFGDVLEVL